MRNCTNRKRANPTDASTVSTVVVARTFDTRRISGDTKSCIKARAMSCRYLRAFLIRKHHHGCQPQSRSVHLKMRWSTRGKHRLQAMRLKSHQPLLTTSRAPSMHSAAQSSSHTRRFPTRYTQLNFWTSTRNRLVTRLPSCGKSARSKAPCFVVRVKFVIRNPPMTWRGNNTVPDRALEKRAKSSHSRYRNRSTSRDRRAKPFSRSRHSRRNMEAGRGSERHTRSRSRSRERRRSRVALQTCAGSPSGAKSILGAGQDSLGGLETMMAEVLSL